MYVIRKIVIVGIDEIGFTTVFIIIIRDLNTGRYYLHIPDTLNTYDNKI